MTSCHENVLRITCDSPHKDPVTRSFFSVGLKCNFDGHIRNWLHRKLSKWRLPVQPCSDDNLIKIIFSFWWKITGFFFFFYSCVFYSEACLSTLVLQHLLRSTRPPWNGYLGARSKLSTGRLLHSLSLLAVGLSQGWFWVCALPMRDGVTV